MFSQKTTTKKKLEDMHLRERINYGYNKVIMMMLISGLFSIVVIGVLFANMVHYVENVAAADEAVKICRINVNASARNIREMALNDDTSSYDGYEQTVKKLLTEVDSELKILKKTGAISNENYEEYATALSDWGNIGYSIMDEIKNGIEITDTLKQILISEDGEIHQFETIAGNLMSDSIESVQLAPNGVVTDIYPANENEAGKIDLIHDKDRGKISRYARDVHTIITQGPIKLKQGGYGIAVRNPVYLKDKNGHEYFWGFTIAILRVPDIFSDSISALSDFGYECKISKTDAPWSDTYKVIYQSDGPDKYL